MLFCYALKCLPVKALRSSYEELESVLSRLTCCDNMNRPDEQCGRAAKPTPS